MGGQLGLIGTPGVEFFSNPGQNHPRERLTPVSAQTVLTSWHAGPQTLSQTRGHDGGKKPRADGEDARKRERRSASACDLPEAILTVHASATGCHQTCDMVREYKQGNGRRGTGSGCLALPAFARQCIAQTDSPVTARGMVA